jgi:hypothetical protein
MSQQPPNRPESNPTPQNDQSRGALKSALIQTLRGTIGLLQGWVERLETEPPPRKKSPKAAPEGQQSGKVGAAWPTALGAVRSILPAAIDRQLSDGVLTGAIALILVVAIALPLTLSFGQPPSEEVARQPVSKPEITPPSPTKSPSEAVETAPDSPPSDIADRAPEAETAPDRAPEPSEPEPLPSPEPEPTPPPKPQLTPEQRLVAAIQAQVAQVTQEYENNELVRSIRANFEDSLLQVRLDEGWHDLDSDAQIELANQMLKKARSLDFSRLEVTDADGTLLARSPVVGSDAVIVQR